VHEIDSTPGPKYSIIAPVPPLTVKIPANLRITSFGDVHPCNWPVNRTPITLKTMQKVFHTIKYMTFCFRLTFGHLTSHGILAITSTASAPPTPIQSPPKPPPFGV
jgi:hypothetical protein